MDLNYFGFLPVNPDDLPETKMLCGAGTNRPIGFLPSEIHNLYWTVRSFKVDVTSIDTSDPFTDFMMNGGSTDTMLGVLGGLTSVVTDFAKGLGHLGGETKIRNSTSLKNRKGMVTHAENPFDLTIIDKDQFGSDIPRIITWETKQNVNEGTICGAGPIHQIVGPLGLLRIDFSSIIYYKRLYWPIIYILLGEPGNEVCISCLASFTKDGKVTTHTGGFADTAGGVELRGALIPMYRSIPAQANGSTAVVLGSIKIGTTCYSRFYHDDKDQERIAACDDSKKVTYQPETT